MNRRDEPYAPRPDARSSFQRRGGRPGKIEQARDARGALLRLARYLKPYRARLALVVGLVLLSSLAGLAGPYLLGRAIDRDIASRDARGLPRSAFLMLGAWSCSAAFSLAANRLMARVSQHSLRRLRAELFRHLQTLSMGFFDTNAPGGLMSRLTNDIDAINQAVSQNVTALVAGSLSMIGIVAAMFALNHWLALGTLVVVPVMFGFTRFVASFTRKGYRRLQRDLGELNALAEEAISGQRVIKVFNRGESMLAAFRERNQAVYESGVYANSFAMLLMPLTQVLGSFFVVVLASLGGWTALRGLVSVGTIATFINYGQNFTSPLRQAANLYNSIQAALAGAERVFELLDLPSEPGAPAASAAPEPAAAGGPPPEARPAPRTARRGKLAFEGVSFSYTPGTPVIRDFDLEVRPGETVALVGPTGAGKTTIINLLARFYEPQRGRVTLDGTDIRGLSLAELRRSLGIVPQETFLFSDSVMENIRYGRPGAGDEDCVAAARLAEADHFIRQLPSGYDTVLGERASNLSQGQRQLLAIARAILSDPAILVLDEATSSVDTRTEARIQAALLRLMEGRTSLVIAHRLSTIRDADRVVVISDGRIAEIGGHEELLARRGLYHRLYLSQFKGNQI